MFRLNLKISLRNLWKNKGYTFINIGGLGLGLASCIILLLYVAYEWGYDKQAPDFERTYLVYNHQQTSAGVFSHPTTPGAFAAEAKQNIPGVSRAARFSYPKDGLITEGQHSFKKSGVYADPDFLKIEGYDFLSGDASSAFSQINTVILTRSLAKSIFGDTDPLGRTVKLDNKEPLMVTGVIKDLPGNKTITFDYLMPWGLLEKQDPFFKNQNWNNNFCMTLVQLERTDLFAKADAQVRQLYSKHESDKISEYTLYPIAKWHLYNNFENGKQAGGKITQVKIFLLLAFCILLIACVNFMNLSTARSEKRGKEVGIRKTIGASKKALVNQFLLESLLMSFCGMLVAFVCIELCLPYFNRLLDTSLTVNYNDWRLWLALIGLTFFTGIVSGSYPAFYLSSFEPVIVLKGIGKSSKSAVSVRQILVVSQFVFAVCLMICSIVIYQQLNFIKNKSIGYNKDQLVEIQVQGDMFKNAAKLKLVKDKLLQSGVSKHVSFFSMSISEGYNNTFAISWPGKNPNDKTLFDIRSTGYDFMSTLGAEMIGGREFSPEYADSSNIIINNAAAQAMGLKTPVGSVIKWGDTDVKIIGLVKDFVVLSPYKKVDPMVIYYNLEDVRYILVRLDPEVPVNAALQKINAVMESVEPGFPPAVKFADDNFETKFQNERVLGSIANWFGGFSIFISCLGLFGLALYMAEQRKKEISIRKVLGANPLQILTLLNKDFMRLVGIANLIAFPLAYLIIQHWLEGYSYRIELTFIPFLIALILSVCIALLTISMQSIKAVRANTVDALKYE